MCSSNLDLQSSNPCLHYFLWEMCLCSFILQKTCMEYNFHISSEVPLCHKLVGVEARCVPCSSLCCIFLGVKWSGYPGCPPLFKCPSQWYDKLLFVTESYSSFLKMQFSWKKIKNCLKIYGSFLWSHNTNKLIFKNSSPTSW